MLKLKLNLQLFAEGGDGGSSAGSTGPDGSGEGLAEEQSGGNPEVIYGKQNTTSTAEVQDGESAPPKEEKVPFEDLIKGDYKEDFERKTQAIINKRFKETKGLQETLQSHNVILEMLSSKYGVDATDVEALQKAIEEDDSFYEQEAFEKNLTVEQLKQIKALERENAEFKRAAEEAEQRAHSEEIYNNWLSEAEAFKQKYGLEDFSLEEEVANADFTRLLSNGISIEAAYIACHPDRIIGGAMAKTAKEGKKGIVNLITSRASRPMENGLSSSTASQIFKSDPSKFTKDDMAEIRQRVMRGERITL